MKNSRWIDKFEREEEERKIILLYGNLYDRFYHENELKSLDEFIEEKNVTDSFFTEKELKEINLRNNNSPDNRNSSNNLSISGYALEDGLVFIQNIIKSIVSSNGERRIFYIKNSSLFFSDNTAKNKEFITHSITLLKEFVANNGDDNNFLIIIVAEKLEYLPTELYLNNPDSEVINITLPEIEEREEFLKYFNLGNDILSQYAKITNGRTLKEIQKIFDVANRENLDTQNPKEVISFYDFGEKESPWTKLKDEEIINIDKILKKRVFGQCEAVAYVKKILIRAKLDLSSVHQYGYSNRPIGTFFFVGPTGVGKTELAKSITEAVFGDENKFKRFDMSEYKEATSINKLIGTSPGYVGYERGGELTNWLKENPFSVILFDEIEKANPLIWDTFLQILEDGRLTDNKGKTVYFKESIIIFTSNIGNEDAKNKNNDESKEVYYQAVDNYFSKILGRVEILNRIGNNIIVFNHIESDEIYTKITENRLDLVIGNIEKKLNCSIKFENYEEKQNVIKFIINKIKERKEKFGGRAVINFLETYFINEFGLYFIMNRKDVIRVSLVENKIVFK